MSGMPNIDWCPTLLIPTFAFMTKSTVGHLFELLMGPEVHTDAQIALLLDVDPMVLQARLGDLRRRGILSGPFEGDQRTWKSWFPTLQATTEATERSGLPASTSVPLRRAWWNAMWANN